MSAVHVRIYLPLFWRRVNECKGYVDCDVRVEKGANRQNNAIEIQEKKYQDVDHKLVGVILFESLQDG